jgi:hypothetical protein
MRIEQLLLGAEPHPLDEAPDELLALRFREAALNAVLHGPSIAHSRRESDSVGRHGRGNP